MIDGKWIQNYTRERAPDNGVWGWPSSLQDMADDYERVTITMFTGVCPDS